MSKDKKHKKQEFGAISDARVFANEPNMEYSDIGEYNKDHMKIFGINVIMSRHVPSIIDGLKPGERRALYSLWNIAGASHKSQLKVERVMSETALIHPHGSTSTYGTIVRLGQSWENMQCAIDTCGGNYGCADGFTTPPAAYRYIECKLSAYALDCFFSDFDPNIVEMVFGYDDVHKEPVYLPSKYPNVLVNGASGMAFGISTCIPTYNVKDLFTYTIKLIDDPELSKGIIAPDSPTGCEIIDEAGAFRELLYEGVSKDEKPVKFRMRSNIEIDEERHTITINNMPAGVSAEALVEGIAALKESGALKSTSINNNTSGEDFEIVLNFRKEVDLYEARELLWNAKLQTVKTFPCQIHVIDDFELKKYSVKDCLLRWIDWRRIFKRRFYNRQLVIDKGRIYVLESLMFIFNKDNAEKTIEIARHSDSREDIIKKLCKAYKGFDSMRAAAVADMRIHEFNKNSYKKFKEEKEKREKRLKANEKILSSKHKIDDIIKDELMEGIKRYGEPRRAKIVKVCKSDAIPDTHHTLVITTNAYVKKLNGNLTEVGDIAQGDTVVELLHVDNRDSLLLFDSKGRVHDIAVNTIRGSDLKSHGYSLSTHLKTEGANIVAVFVKNEHGQLATKVFKPTDSYFVLTTKRGLIKKTPYDAFTRIKGSSTAAVIKDGDELVSVKYVNNDTDIVVYTYTGKGLRFNTDSISETKRMSSGVKAFKVDENDAICDTVVISKKDTHLFTLTMKGYAKALSLDALGAKDRRSDSETLTNLHAGDLMAFARGVRMGDKYAVVLMSRIDEIIIGKDVPEQFRLNKGAKVVAVKKGDKIIKLAKIGVNAK